MKQLFGLGAFKNAPIRKKLILSTWLVAIVPIVVIFAVVFFVFVNTGAESARRQAQLLLDKTVEEMDGYFNQAQESLAFMVTDMNMQTAIDNYVSGTYKEQLDLRDFLRNRLANVSTVGRRTAAISIYIKEADRTYSRDFSDQPLSGIYGGEPWFEDLLAGKESFAQTEGISVQDQRPVWILASNIISVRNGVDAGRITREKMCELLSENPAKLYGMYPLKGAIAPGSDADIVVMRTGVDDVVTAGGQVQNVDYAPFEGSKLTARIESVYLRGTQVVKDHQVVVEKAGKFVKRGKYDL